MFLYNSSKSTGIVLFRSILKATAKLVSSCVKILVSLRPPHSMFSWSLKSYFSNKTIPFIIAYEMSIAKIAYDKIAPKQDR